MNHPTPRNPRYFPHMKVRGARRRRLAPWQRAAGALERLGAAMNASAVSLSALINANRGHR